MKATLTSVQFRGQECMEPRLSPPSNHHLMISCEGAEALHCLPMSLRHCLSVAEGFMEKAYGDCGGKGEGKRFV